jgi:large subunit ribosomal protein L5
MATPKVHPFLKHYRDVVVPKLQEQLGRKNILSLPRPLKVTLNVGLGKAKDDERLAQVAVQTLERASGQKPVLTLARKSIAAFKIREGMNVGAMVTLRGLKMWDMLEKLVAVTLPRVRDFHGVSRRGIDRQGNFTIGFREHLVLPEISSDEVEKIHGFEVTITTTARNADEAYVLLKAMGFPFND